MAGICNLHITMTPFRNESRLLKQARTLVASDEIDEVLIAALWEEGLAPRERAAPGIEVIRLRLWTRHLGRNLAIQMLKYVELTLRVIWLAFHHRVRIINCHALALLPLGVLARLLSRARLIYDPHELETERAGLIGLRKRLSQIVERALIGFCDHTFVVGEKIREDYMQRYAITRVTTVMNCPYASSDLMQENLFRARFDIPAGDVIFLYQGLLDEGRGLGHILEAFTALSSDREAQGLHLVVMGYGPFETRIKAACAVHPCMHFHPSVLPGEVLRHTASADIGLCLIEPICLSYAYSLPNKFFEYLSCGMHVLCSDLPEMRLHGEGLAHVSLLEAPTAEVLAEACKGVAQTLRDQGDKPVLPERYSWDYQGRIMLEVYKQDIFPKVRVV